MSEAVEAWSQFVARAGRDVRELDVGLGELEEADDLAAVDALANVAFRVGLGSLLVGAEDLGRLALAMERTLAAVSAKSLPIARACSLLVPARAALVDAIVQLESPDKSGARIEGIPLVPLATTLESAVPESGPEASRRTSTRSRPAPTAPAAPAPLDPSATPGFAWAPAVDEDMVELFFDEARERIDAISGKLITLEQRGGDADLLGDLFRDLHTVKGSSAMVGLAPMNRLAHASEDLVGQLRDGTRAVDAPVVDVLLATLDRLREMLDLAQARRPITTDPEPVIRALRDPHATRVAPAPAAPAAARPAEVTAPARGDAQKTIRVDFDKLDRLMNLVGELVLGRDGLESAHAALTSVTGELSADRALARRMTTADHARRARRLGTTPTPSSTQKGAERDLAEELGRVERVLDTIAGDLDQSTSHLQTVSSELRDQVMKLRMVQVGGVFRKHQRTVRDLGQTLGKRVRLELAGDETELDKLLVDALDEPLMHLIRNAVDHGVEPPDVREAAGKPAEAVVRLQASHRGNQVVIRISDDGRGMDPAALKRKAREKGIATEAELEAMDDRAALEIVFRPGFSTATTISDVSGRGVGMDVVRQTIVARLKGSIDIESELGRGTSFVLKLPLTLAIIQVLLARVAGETFAVPLEVVERTIVVPERDVRLVGDREVIDVAGEAVPLIRLASVLEIDSDSGAGEDLHIALVGQGDALFGFACDRMLGKREIVIKSLGEILSGVPCVAGATLLGDRCALILDVPAILERAVSGAARAHARDERRASGPSKANVLLVEDSDTVRESLRRLLVDAGYAVTTAEDGRVGLELAKSTRFDIVSTDVMMPHMDGYELTRALRSLAGYKDTPIVMVTSRGELIDRVRGFDAGVDDYITKPHDRQLLLRSIRRLLGHDKDGAT
ncbi:MAG: response regulator [Polyangiaceae bacterium]